MQPRGPCGWPSRRSSAAMTRLGFVRPTRAQQPPRSKVARGPQPCCPSRQLDERAMLAGERARPENCCVKTNDGGLRAALRSFPCDPNTEVAFFNPLAGRYVCCGYENLGSEVEDFSCRFKPGWDSRAACLRYEVHSDCLQFGHSQTPSTVCADTNFWAPILLGRTAVSFPLATSSRGTLSAPAVQS